MKIISFESLDQINNFNKMLYWWGTIRENYKEQNVLTAYFDMAYDYLIDDVIDEEMKNENG